MTAIKSIRTKATIAIVIVSLIYASIGIPVRVLASHFTLFQQLYLWLTASTILSCLLFVKNIRWHVYRRLSLWDIIILTGRALAFYTIGYSLYSTGITNAKYGSVAVIYAFPMMAVLGPLFLGEKLTNFKLGAVIGAVIGALFIGLKDVTSVVSFGFGELATLVSVFFFAVSDVARKFQSERLNNYEMTVFMFVVATVSTFFLSVAVGEPLAPLNWSTPVFAAVLATGLMNALALLFTNYGYKYLDVITAGTISYVDTAFGIIISIILYKEIPTIKEAFGGLLIVASALFIHHVASRQPDS